MESIDITNLAEDFQNARDYVETILQKSRISDVGIYETMLVFEAVCQKIFSDPSLNDPVVHVYGRERLGYSFIRLSFEGRMFHLDNDGEGEWTPEDRILKAYADKIDNSYFSGFNRISITVRRSSIAALEPCLIGMTAAFVVYTLLCLVTDTQTQLQLLDHLILPLETLFINAVIMVGTPVTFASFLKNMTDIFILSERNSSVRKYQRGSILTSIAAVVLAILLSLGVSWLIGRHTLTFSSSWEDQVRIIFNEGVSSLIPPNIISPFMTFSPFPVIIVAVLVVCALCFSGMHFENMKNGIETVYALFSRMLSIVTYALPFFVFMAFMDVLLYSGARAVWYLFLLCLVFFTGLFVLNFFYVFRLWRKGIAVVPFAKTLLPLLRENWKIGSAIDAVPFNIRYCMRHFHRGRQELETALPVLAQINLDGNCFCITLIALVYMLTVEKEVPILLLLLIPGLIFFLSLGAPNQPGSFLIAFSIILMYIKSSDMLSLAIICELFFGGFINLINVTGDIVSVMEEGSPPSENTAGSSTKAHT